VPAVEVVARNQHRGHIEPASAMGGRGKEIRPVCDSCGWKGPRYVETDEPVAQVGLDAHIATADSSGDSWMYQITIPGGTAVWDWEIPGWQ
jgi:hypothetical protein